MLEFNSMGKKKVKLTNNLLMHFDGNPGSTVFKDEYGRTINRSGNPTITNALSKFGGTCGFFNKEALILPDPIKLVGDYTIEAWIYVLSFPTSGSFNLLTAKGAVTNGEYKFPAMFNQAPGNIGIWLPPAFPLTAFNGDIALSTWAHLAVTRSGTIYRGFINGVSKYTQDKPVIQVDIDYLLGWIAASYNLNGYVDEMRILDGTAAYTANFTPPTEPFTI